jgi:CRP-like cAMP-binding protein
MSAELGRIYEDGEIIVRMGDVGNCMHIMQAGEADVILDREGKTVPVALLTAGDAFGEMALFTKEPRTATIRARGRARVLTVDKRQFLRRVHEDPSLAFGILLKLSLRIQELDLELARLRTR